MIGPNAPIEISPNLSDSGMNVVGEAGCEGRHDDPGAERRGLGTATSISANRICSWRLSG
jgi:hypothetical protein